VWGFALAALVRILFMRREIESQSERKRERFRVQAEGVAFNCGNSVFL